MDFEQEKFDEFNNGKLYRSTDADVADYQAKKVRIVDKYNKTTASKWGKAKKKKLIKKMFAEAGDHCYLEVPIHSNFGCSHVHLGEYFYSNYNLTLVDDSHIYIGNHVMIGPNTTLCTANHPADPELRDRGYQYNKPVKIGNGVWIGGHVIVLPGVTIGDNSIIGAGSVVTKDIPANVVAFGNPCRVYREITKEDRKFYDHDKPVDQEIYKTPSSRL